MSTKPTAHVDSSKLPIQVNDHQLAARPTPSAVSGNAADQEYVCLKCGEVVTPPANKSTPPVEWAKNNFSYIPCEGE
ncbi:hypothetical protein RYH80_17930 [Halobaculum sp. MBLA0147]|uniref:hypothetical protein n=1 Tax=Halobaculum sp. MBLA0147 TaxID=3079934 RepID=UPI00352669E6